LQAAFWEWGKLLESGQLATVTQAPISFAIASMAGFGVNALAVTVIKLTSSLTLKVGNHNESQLLPHLSHKHIHPATDHPG
jgi:hypothetical protein